MRQTGNYKQMLDKLEDIEEFPGDIKLGEGLHSVVKKVRSKKDGKIYALKKINLKNVAKEDCDNLKREIEIHRRLEHPHVIRFVDCLQIEFDVYVLLELAVNNAVFYFIPTNLGLPEAFAFRFLYQAAEAVAFIHSKGIMHRDIKPENLLVDENFNLKLSDFGWAREIGSRRLSICGTFEYMAPEILNESGHGKAVDVWALGVFFYELLHGKAPYPGTTFRELKASVNTKELSLREGLSPQASGLLIRLLSQDPRRRPKAVELLKMLGAPPPPLAPQDIEFLHSRYGLPPASDISPAFYAVPVRLRQLDHHARLMYQLSDDAVSPLAMPRQRPFSADKLTDLKSLKSDKDQYSLLHFARERYMNSTIVSLAIETRFDLDEGGRIILLERDCDWQDALFQQEKRMHISGKILFVICFDPALKCFKIEAVREENQKFVVRKLINETLKNMPLAKIKEHAELKDTISINSSGVLAFAKTLYCAVAISKLSIAS